MRTERRYYRGVWFWSEKLREEGTLRRGGGAGAAFRWVLQPATMTHGQEIRDGSGGAARRAAMVQRGSTRRARENRRVD
jgi:hypothetical protein